MGKEKKAFERKEINVFWALVPLLVMIVYVILGGKIGASTSYSTDDWYSCCCYRGT